jgi:SCP-2 sterol transfer family
VRIYSPEWVDAFNRAAAGEHTDGEVAGDDADAKGGGDFRLLQVVNGAPEGTVHIGIESTGGRVVMTLGPPAEPAPEVTITIDYDDAVALSRGELEPARLVAAGRVKVRGNLSVLVDGQAVLAGVAARVAELSGPAGA